jgi:NADH-quinone oxidoreductase subunit A
MVSAYLPVFVMVVFAFVMALGLFLASWFLGKVKGSRTELMPYECGLDPMDAPFKRVSVRYYVVALLFLLFDVETLFLFPVAAVFRERTAMGWGLFVYGEMLVFLAILLVGYVYALKKGALRWE